MENLAKTGPRNSTNILEILNCTEFLMSKVGVVEIPYVYKSNLYN